MICINSVYVHEIGYRKFKTQSKSTHRGLQIKAATLSLGYLLAPDVDLPRPKNSLCYFLSQSRLGMKVVIYPLSLKSAALSKFQNKSLYYVFQLCYLWYLMARMSVAIRHGLTLNLALHEFNHLLEMLLNLIFNIY